MNEKPVLITREGQLLGEKWTVDVDDFVIGRGSDCQIILPERQVSRYHARITSDNGKYTLHDLDSKNGTHLNGIQVKGSVPVRDGDEIQIALAVKLLFIGTDATIPLTVEDVEVPTNMKLDKNQRAVRINDQELDPPLSLAQFRLLEVLFDAKGAVVDREKIIEAVWPGTDGIGVSEQAIDALVRRLRDRLAELDEYEYVVTVRGHGFRLENDPH
jgi:pSer/pThr/pTyr-binding forkhead associated (FHA) protein